MAEKRTRKPAQRKGKAGTSKSSREDKKALFVEAFLSNGGNATEAALSAGYSKGGAAKSGYRLTKDVQVMSMIRQRQDELAKKYSLTTEDVIRSISQELHFDPLKLFKDDGSLRPITELDEDTRKALVSVETVQVGSAEAPIFIRKLKWAQKATAREQAMKHLGMFERDNRQRNPLEDLPRDVLKAIRDRLNGLNGR